MPHDVPWPTRFEPSGFSCSYSCELLPALPPTGAVRQFGIPGKLHHRVGAVVSVKPARGDLWVGSFEPGDGGFSRVLGTPSPRHVLIIVRGFAYVVCVEDTGESEMIMHDTQRTWSYPDRGLVVLADSVHFVAYGVGRLAWKSRRVSADGLEFTACDGGRIEGNAWDPAGGSEKKFVLDVATGRVEGGVEG